jgi:hypothetical protein
MTMGWLWGGNSPEKPGEVPDKAVELRDQSLQMFYESAKPPTPIALAPKTVQESTYEPITTKAQKSVDFQVRRKLSLQQVARDNCVEFEMALSNCLLRGSLWDRFLSCHSYKMNQQKCTELQEFALTVLGYNKALNEQHKRDIRNKADDLMIEYVPDGRITDDAANLFKAAVEREHVAAQQSSYRI